MKSPAILLVLGLALAIMASAAVAAEDRAQIKPHPGGWIEANWLIGTKIHDANDREIGKVKELWLDPKDGRMREVVVTTGAVLGLGGKDQVLDWKDVKIAWKGQSLYVTTEPKLMRDIAEAGKAGAASPKTR